MVRRWVAAVAGAFVLGSLVVAPAAAHDALLASDPPDGAVLEAAPEEIALEFTGKVLDINPEMQLTDADGAEHAVSEARIDGTSVTWDLLEPLPAGTFDVIWVVTSSDGHPIDGKFSFTVEAGAEPEASGTPEPAPGDADAEPAPSDPVSVEPLEPEDDATQDPADISDNAWAWLVAGAGVTLLLLVLAIIMARRNRDPNGPPGQH